VRYKIKVTDTETKTVEEFEAERVSFEGKCSKATIIKRGSYMPEVEPGIFYNKFIAESGDENAPDIYVNENLIHSILPTSTIL